MTKKIIAIMAKKNKVAKNIYFRELRKILDCLLRVKYNQLRLSAPQRGQWMGTFSLLKK